MTSILRASLDVLYYSGAARALQPVLGGMGAVFTMHHVFPGAGPGRRFAPNAVLEITPAFLDETLTMLDGQGFEFVSMDEVAQRVAQRVASGVAHGRRFAAFTLDDGYRDNLIHARPVFQKHRCPYAIYVTTAITDGRCELWWLALEHLIANQDRLECRIGERSVELPLESDAQRWDAWKRLYWPIRAMEPQEQRRWIRELATRCGLDIDQLCRSAAMDWGEVRQIASDPLCTIGAHTVNHYASARLDEQEALGEMVRSADRIEQEIGRRPRHFAYPYGDADSAGPRDFALAKKAGFVSAVTTRKGIIYPEHREHLMALPRLSLAGGFQATRYVRTLSSGLPFYLFNGLRRLNVS